jgi:uncharacterized membrane protein YcaP (DUF421 family)
MLTDLLVPGIPIAEKLLRTLCVYSFLLVGLRLAGKRELGQLNPFDLVVLLLLSNTVQNAIIGNDNSLVGGIAGATALLLINWVVVRYLYTHPAIARLIEGDSDLLIRDGVIREKHLRRELITRAELEAAARRQGLEGLHAVRSCRLEVGGALTFVQKTPTVEDTKHAMVMQRLDELAAAQARIMERIAMTEGGHQGA